jgi:hypothetical protein
MNFRASFCDPFKQNIVELGSIAKKDVIAKFESIDWQDWLLKMNNVHESEIYYSPSLEIENLSNKHGLAISAVGDDRNFEFYIFYKRPKTIKTFFGLKEKHYEDYLTDKTGQTRQDVIDCLNALMADDTAFLDSKLGA